MKILAPWDTSIIDRLPIDASDKVLIKFWIWCDRLLWIGVSAGTVAALAIIAK